MIDWPRLGEETVDVLRRYLMVDTTNPPGGETEGARFLEALLRRDGIASETAESAPGRGNLVARVAGDGSLPAIVLHHHIDVVYADRRYWTVDPFGGEIHHGYLYGRGAIDMKSTGILQVMAAVALKRAGVPLKRDLVLLATADEEAGSRFGAQWVAAERPQWLANAEYALSELGFVHTPEGASAPVGSIVISEKTGLPLRLTARSTPGHGSMPWPDTAPNRLIRALGRLLEAEREPRVLPEVRDYFQRLGSVLPDAAGFDDVERALGDAGFRASFLVNRHHAAMVRTTFAVTMLRGSEKRNVIPPVARADIDCRMLAGDDPEEIRAWVGRVVADEHVEVEITGTPKQPNLSPPDTELYKHLADSLRRRVPGVVVAPEILVGFTDNWVFRRAGLAGYGYSPFVFEEDEIRRVHGNDERISLENIEAGVRSYADMLLAVAGA